MKSLPTRGIDPVRANRTRKTEKHLTYMIRHVFVIRSSRGRISRKRKKYMYRVERANYRALIVAIANHLVRGETP